MAPPSVPTTNTPVVVELRTDAFAQNLRNTDLRPPSDGVRRPLRGFEVKEDTYAILKVIRADGSTIPLTDAAGPLSLDPADSVYSLLEDGKSGGEIYERLDKKPDEIYERLDRRRGSGTRLAATYNYANFLIQQIEESRQEKSQVMETFGDTFVFFFGERPRVLNVTGILMNTLDFNWRAEFWYNYENVLRGTKLVEQNARIYLFYDDLVVEGYMLGAMARDVADMPYQIPFSFQLFVTNHQYLGTIGQEDYPITHAVNLTPLLTSAEAEIARSKLMAMGIEVHKSTTLVNSLFQLASLSFGGKNAILEGMALGVESAALAFLSNVKAYFANGEMILPTRTLPYRTKLRDNRDEFIQNYEWHGRGTSYWDVRNQRFATEYDAKAALVRDLGDSGVDIYGQISPPASYGASHSVMVAGSSVPVTGMPL